MMRATGRPAGRVALVTGAARGIGRAIASELARGGARVVVVDRDEAGARAAAAAIHRSGGTALAVAADVSEEADVARMARAALDRFRRVDILVNNVGVYTRADWAGMTAGAWRASLDVNLTSQFLCARAVAAGMKVRRWGRIVNVSSVTFALGWPAGLAHYNAAKGGVIGLTRSLARELGPWGITVNAVAPGAVATPEERKVATAKHVAGIVERQCLKRRVTARDVARAVVFLASDDASAITGQTLNVDGGWVLQ